MRKARNHHEAGINKRPSEPVYAKDLLSERTLIMAPPAVKGAWGWCLLVMWADSTDRVHGTFEELGRLWGCTGVEAKRLSEEIKGRKIGRVTLGPGCVTLINRRLERRYQCREQARIRKKLERSRKGHGDVTGKNGGSSSSSSPSSSIKGGGEGLFLAELVQKREAKEEKIQRLWNKWNFDASVNRKKFAEEWTMVERLKEEVGALTDKIAGFGE